MKATYKTIGYKTHRSVNTPQPLELWDIDGRGKIHRLMCILNGEKHSKDSRYDLVGVRQYMERVPSPKGILRFRMQILGTGQVEPCYSIFEVWTHVVGPKGRLP